MLDATTHWCEASMIWMQSFQLDIKQKFNRSISILILLSLLFNFKTYSQISKAEWQEDLLYLKNELSGRHIMPYRHISKSGFDSLYQLFHDSLQALPDPPNKEIASSFIFQLTASLRDPHTSVWGRYGHFGIIPCSFGFFQGDVYLLSTTSEHADFIGGRIVSIEGQPVSYVLDRLQKVVPHSNELGFMDIAPGYLRTPGVLKGLGLIDNPEEVNMEIALRGQVRAVKFSRIKLKDYREATKESLLSSLDSLPLYQQKRGNYWMEWLPDQAVLYVRYARCSHSKKKGDKINVFWQNVFAHADSVDVQKLIIDLRNNPGGQPDLVYPLLSEINKRPELNQQGKIYAFVNEGTQSAAIIAAMLLDGYTNTMLVGNGIGDRPHHLSDARISRLPNSKLKIGIPILYCMNTFDLDMRYNIEPHIKLETTFSNYKNGVDPYMDSVLAYRAKPLDSIDLPNDYLGSYCFSEDKSVNVSYMGKAPIVELSSGWRTAITNHSFDRNYYTQTPGLKIRFEDNLMIWTLPDGDTIQMKKLEKKSSVAMDLLKERKWSEAKTAYVGLKLTHPYLKATQRNNLTTQAFLFYYLLNDEKLAHETMRLNVQLHKDKGFVFISRGLLYSAQGKKLKVIGSFFNGVIKGYKD